jgi:hypothetical protein
MRKTGVMLMDGLGHCDWTSDNSLGGLGALEGCPNTSPTVVFNQDSLPTWVLYAIAAWGLWMAFKK